MFNRSEEGREAQRSLSVSRLVRTRLFFSAKLYLVLYYNGNNNNSLFVPQGKNKLFCNVNIAPVPLDCYCKTDAVFLCHCKQSPF